MSSLRCPQGMREQSHNAVNNQLMRISVETQAHPPSTVLDKMFAFALKSEFFFNVVFFKRKFLHA